MRYLTVAVLAACSSAPRQPVAVRQDLPPTAAGPGSATPTTAKVVAGDPGGVDLDKPIIRKAIKTKLDKITYCYEKALLAQPTLAGTVWVEFEIGGDGIVTRAVATGMDGAVATCVAGVVQTVVFPTSINGKPTKVNYPFTFRPAGDAAGNAAATGSAAKPAGDAVDTSAAGAGGGQGSLDRQMISAGVAAVKDRVVACGTGSSIKGVVKIRVEVAPDGHVVHTTVERTPDAKLGECVAAALEQSTFAATQTGGTFSYPFVF